MLMDIQSIVIGFRHMQWTIIIIGIMIMMTAVTICLTHGML